MTPAYMGFQLCRRCNQPLVGYEADRDICESCWHIEQEDEADKVQCDDPQIVDVEAQK